MAVFLVLGLTLQAAAPRGTSSERIAEVGIALEHSTGDRRYYETGPGGSGKDRSAIQGAESGAIGANLGEFLSDTPPLDPTGALPSPQSAIGPHALGDGGVPHAGGLTAGPGRNRGSPGGKGRASLFGVTGEGWKFVYVLDRSDSMNWHDRKPILRAKAELLASLESLDSNHQFQIIFYNHQPEIFNPSGQKGKLAFATEQNKRNAARFVQGITASGGTDHMAALRLGLSLQPDVLFLLTDADDPQLSAGQLAEIERRAGGTTIHTIEFGLKPQGDPNNFLVKLARQNGGQHVYVDISQF